MAPLKVGEKFPAGVKFDASHVPPYVQQIEKLSSKGVDQVLIIGYNDAFVMNAWGKVQGLKTSDKIKFMCDSSFSNGMGKDWKIGDTGRNERWAMVIEKDLTISHLEKEDDFKKVTVSGADSIIGKL